MEVCMCFFNLIAILVEKARRFDDYRHTQRIADSEAVAVNAFVDGIICKHFNPSVKPVKMRLSITQEDINGILNSLEGKHFYYFSALITRLDKLLSSEDLYNWLKYDPDSGGEITEYYFECLNDNSEETGICIYPNIQAVNMQSKKGGLGKTRLENDLKESLENIYYVAKRSLKGYRVVNLVLKCKLKDKNNLSIAVTPLCNTLENELLDVNHFEAEHNGVGIKLLNTKLKDPQKSNDAFKAVLSQCSKDRDIDIVLGPEVLGTREFSEVNGYGYNDVIRNMEDGFLPTIIIPPTYAHDSSNVLSVFYNSGEKLGEQHKQEPYDDKKAKEDLRNSKREIFVLHIRGIGRVCFLICKDFLKKYSDIMISELKANLILCPSYSKGARRFNASKNIATGNNCRVVWINCCSAFDNRKKKNAFIGFAAGNNIPDSTRYLNCMESSQCSSCYYKIKIPLNAAGGEFYNDKQMTIEHKRI